MIPLAVDPFFALNGVATVTTIQINPPDQLAQEAQIAGLVTREAIEAMLREQLKKQAGEKLIEFWNDLPAEKLAPEIEQEIVGEVRAGRQRRAGS